jgi:RNA polymerase sigma-70 factor (family 1)
MAATAWHNESLFISQFREGREEAFRHVYMLLHEKVLFFAKRLVGSVPDAEDFTTESFVRLWQHRHQINSLDEAAAYLHTIVRNRCYDHLRHEQRSSEHMKQLQSEEEQAEPFDLEYIHTELLGKIYAEVEKLPARMKEIFLLSYRDGLRPAEIAKQLQLSVQTVKNQRLTAIRILKEVLSQNSAAVALLILLEIQCR